MYPPTYYLPTRQTVDARQPHVQVPTWQLYQSDQVAVRRMESSLR